VIELRYIIQWNTRGRDQQSLDRASGSGVLHRWDFMGGGRETRGTYVRGVGSRHEWSDGKWRRDG
jgi:hypothetical protein